MSSTTLHGGNYDYKASLLSHLIANKALTFGSYILKSGRESPYFLTSSLLHTAPLLHETASAFASVISSPPFVTESADGQISPNFDVIFGPAYKGIPLCTAILTELAVRDALAPENKKGVWNNVSYAFNRKEAKDHGEGGNIVGASLKGKRVLIVDDVITAGTALREAVKIIEKEGGTVAGVVILFNREERVSETEPKSAVAIAERDLGGKIPIRAVLLFSDLIEKLGDQISENDMRRLEEYRAKYKAE